MHWHFRYSKDFQHPGCQQWILANHGEGRGPGQNGFSMARGIILIQAILFDLTSAPATFQKDLDLILSGFKWKTCRMYLDDVIVFPNFLEGHLQQVAEILQILQSVYVLWKLSKYDVFLASITSLGHVVKPGRVEIESCVVQSLKKALLSRNERDLLSLVWSCTLYRRIIHNFAHIAGQPNEMLRKGTLKVLDDLKPKQLVAFHTFIETLARAPILQLA